MSFLPAQIIDLAASRFIAGDLPGLAPESLMELSKIHERRGEKLSAMQYAELAEQKEKDE